MAGSDKVQLVEERRWPLIGHKMSELHQGYGLVGVIKWRDQLIAWANEKVCTVACIACNIAPLQEVVVYDNGLKEIISFIRFDEER